MAFLLRQLHALADGKRPILGAAVAAALAALVFVLFWPPTYASTGLIKPPRVEGSTSIGAAFDEEEGKGLGSMLGAFLGAGQSGEDDCLALLGSSRFAELVIARFDLVKVYELDSKKKLHRADVIKAFHENVDVEVTEEGALRVRVEDESPQRARDMVDFMIRALDSIYTELQRGGIRQRLAYVDRRVSLAEADLKRLEDSLAAFQLKHNLYLPEVQVQAIMENAARTELEIEVVEEDMAMETAMRGTSGSRYRELATRKRLLEEAMGDKLRADTGPDRLSRPVRKIPHLAAEYMRLERAYKVRLGVYKYLIQQAEGLKLEADRNIQVLTVIDPPWVDDKRVFPKPAPTVALAAGVALLLAALGVLARAWFRRRVDGDQQALEIISGIRRDLLLP